MRVNGVVVFFGMAFLLASGLASAQTSGQDASGTARPPALKPPIFPTMFPHPTNNNGYEEWVQAADLIQNNPKVETLNNAQNPTLALKRQVLADPKVAQALQLVRTGLEKQVFSPRTSFDENTLLPELSSFRRLARLLRYQLYAAFADGRVEAAVDDLRVGLAFAYRVQTDSLISGLVGVAIDSIVLKEFSQHLDQLSANQCNEVRRVVEDFLNAESPVVHLLALEKDQALKARRSDAAGLMALLQGVIGADAQNEERLPTIYRGESRGERESSRPLLK